MRLPPAAVLIGLAFSVTLAVVVGQRLSDQVMIVVVGVIAGVAASVPTSLIVVWIALRSTARADSQGRASAPEPERQPRVVVVQSPPIPVAPFAQPSAFPMPPAPAPERAARSFTVIGGDELD